MKLCHVVPSLQQEHGGPSKSVRALCRALARAGHEVELLATAPDAPKAGVVDEKSDNLLVRIFRRDSPQRICPSSGLRQALMESSAEIVHHHALWLRTLHYAANAARRSGAPLVISPRGMMSAWAWKHHGFRKRISRALIHPHALDAAAAWHVTSPEEQSEVQGLGFPQPVCVAPNGVDHPTETEIVAARDHWLAACPEIAGRPTALFYGRFHQKKRVIELIDLWLERAPPDWLLLLVGIPEDYTPIQLERYVQKMSAGGRVRAFDGAGRPAPYAVASLFVLASHNENFGLVVAEAMAHSVPVLVTDSTPWQGLNADERGWCVPWARYGDAIAAATAESADQLAARGVRARDWVVSEYSWDKSAAVLGEFYKTLRGGRTK